MKAIAISELCHTAGISRQAYYQYQKRPVPHAEAENDTVASAIAEIYVETDGIYGDRQMCHAVNKALRTGYNRKRIYRLMTRMGLKSVTRIKKKQYVPHTPQQVAENVLNREFHAAHVNEKWLTDVTEFKALNGEKAYLSAIIDLYDNSIVAYKFSRANNNQLVFDTFTSAIHKHPQATPLVHSDRGFQYTSYGFKKILDVQQIQQSMSRVGRCIDNGPIEAFWGKIKSERFHIRRKQKYYADYQTIIEDITRYIEFYNHHRPQHKFKGLSPLEFRALAA
ncbi:IS3 family transposase [Salinicoccus siamensis]